MSKVRDAKAKKAAEDQIEDEIIDFEQVQGPKHGGHSGGPSLGDLERYKYLIGGGIAVVLLLVGGYYLFQYFQGEKNVEAEKEIRQAFKFYEKDSVDKAVKGTSQFKGLQAISEDYGGTKTGQLATYMLGTAELSNKKYDDAIAHLESFNKGDNMVAASAYGALAVAYEEKNSFEEAAKTYVKASKIKPNDKTTPYFLFHAARCYEQAKNTTQALDLYKEIKRQYPTSEQGTTIEKYIARLEPDGE